MNRFGIVTRLQVFKDVENQLKSKKYKSKLGTKLICVDHVVEEIDVVLKMLNQIYYHKKSDKEDVGPAREQLTKFRKRLSRSA